MDLILGSNLNQNLEKNSMRSAILFVEVLKAQNGTLLSNFMTKITALYFINFFLNFI
jgi:hypothetical protein